MQLIYVVVNLTWCTEMFRGEFQDCCYYVQNHRTAAYIDGIVLLKSSDFDRIKK